MGSLGSSAGWSSGTGSKVLTVGSHNLQIVAQNQGSSTSWSENQSGFSVYLEETVEAKMRNIYFAFDHCCDGASYTIEYGTSEGVEGSMGGVNLSGCGLITASVRIPTDILIVGTSITLKFTNISKTPHPGGTTQVQDAAGNTLAYGPVGGSFTFTVQ